MRNFSKKSKFTMLLLILMLIISLLILAGCGNQNVTTQNPGGENTEEQPKENNNTEIKTVVQDFKEGNDGAIVRLGNDYENYYVIDREGKVLYTFKIEENSVSANDIEYSNGYLLVDDSSGYGDDKQVTNYVKNLKDGSTIIEGSAETEYVGITQSGYFLQRATIDSLSGKTYESRIVDKDGNIIWKNEDYWNVEYFKVITGDYVAYLGSTSSGKYMIINATNGQTLDLGFSCIEKYFDCTPYGDYLLVGSSANNDNYQIVDLKNFTIIHPKLSHVNKILNDQYIYAKPLYGIVGIYTIDGTLAKDLSEGEVEDIFYANNTYYVMSRTGFFYTLNDSFEYVKQPAKMLEDTYSSIDIGENYTSFVSGVTNYCIPTSEFSPDTDLTEKATKGSISSVNSDVAFLTSDGTTKLVDLNNDLQEIQITK